MNKIIIAASSIEINGIKKTYAYDKFSETSRIFNFLTYWLDIYCVLNDHKHFKRSKVHHMRVKNM